MLSSVAVQTPVTPCLVGQQTTTGIPVTSTSGYLSSVVADSTGCGRMRSPWSITVQRGQTIRITLYDFGLHSRSKIRTSHVAGTPVTPPPCVLYAVLREPLAAIAQNISVCGGLQRQSVIYTSTTHRLDVGMVHSDQNNHIPHFLLQYTGCMSHKHILNAC